jgi:hypothetical protein
MLYSHNTAAEKFGDDFFVEDSPLNISPKFEVDTKLKIVYSIQVLHSYKIMSVIQRKHSIFINIIVVSNQLVS